MKSRYVLFIWLSYEAYGGWGDYYAGNDDLSVLTDVAKKCMSHHIRGDIWSIIDLTTFYEVAEGTAP